MFLTYDAETNTTSRESSRLPVAHNRARWREVKGGVRLKDGLEQSNMKSIDISTTNHPKKGAKDIK